MKPYYIRNLLDKTQKLYRFDNNYGAFVIRQNIDCEEENDLYELAVIKFDTNANWNIDYTTPITNDTIEHITKKDVTKLLHKIKEL